MVSGEALLIVEGEERPLRAWDFVHCPPGRTTSSSAPARGPVSSSPRARGSTRREIGAATPSTRPHSVTGRVSRPRPRIPRRRMRPSRSGASRAIRRVGCLDRGSRGAARPHGERAAGGRRRLVRRQRPRCSLGRVGEMGVFTRLGEGKAARFPQLGFNIGVLWPGQPACMYHREPDREGFLVLSGECILLVEGQQRHMKQWDYFHCPADTDHLLIASGDEPCVAVAVGSRASREVVYPVSELAGSRGFGREGNRGSRRSLRGSHRRGHGLQGRLAPGSMSPERSQVTDCYLVSFVFSSRATRQVGARTLRTCSGLLLGSTRGSSQLRSASTARPRQSLRPTGAWERSRRSSDSSGRATSRFAGSSCGRGGAAATRLQGMSFSTSHSVRGLRPHSSTI